MSLTWNQGAAGGSGRRGGAWARRDLVQTLGARLLAVGGGHHVDRVGAAQGRTGAGVGRVQGREGSRRHGGQRSQLSQEGGAGRGQLGRGGRGLLLAVIHAHQDLEAVARDDALATVERAEPPAVQALRVPLQHGQDVPLPEGQLVRRLRHIVVQSLGQHVLQDRTSGEKREKATLS